MGLQHTSVPRWPTEDPGVDRTGQAYAVMSFGPDAAPVAAGWESELRSLGRPVWSWHGEEAGDGCLAELRGQVESATVGWRLMLAGPQCDVLRAHAEALAGGVLEAEITVLVTDAARTRVWCAHCGATTLADAAIGETAGCSGCGRSLYVYHHVSRRSGTHLGFQVDAEELQ
ncbi:dimethylamine monooxygenase subunit DmmA family protein [Streptomyces sp. NPDC002896]|uniref:dimethylamine monooxygenase subunit DmmA family protein n=1 Tax=Streptomyces sp. NPDC002896 TaxID=3154438 RepID=UPI0033208E2A